MIDFVVKRKSPLAIGAGVLVFLLFAAAADVLTAPILLAPGVILAGLAWFLFNLLGEIVQVIAETLLPR
ncbi:hypothetical protein POM99_16965 [Novosphingobium sp. HBC54]|uniref:Uncharacterized protein n=2 Tax=Novosphingobium cyanobacteriorum TaxID=3024215 RepID=A0ABT6CLV8_9SPHN|nr:hypothetical protein [Novosphingobium cyanobacteriorum]